MTGDLLLDGKERHRCDPPYRPWYNDFGVGSIWRCECGQYFRYWAPRDDPYWYRMTRWRAERILRKAGKL